MDDGGGGCYLDLGGGAIYYYIFKIYIYIHQRRCCISR